MRVEGRVMGGRCESIGVGGLRREGGTFIEVGVRSGEVGRIFSVNYMSISVFE